MKHEVTIDGNPLNMAGRELHIAIAGTPVDIAASDALVEVVNVGNPIPPTGPTLYVSTAGNDANDGSTESKALRLIQTAVDRAVAGVTVVVMPGAYVGAVVATSGIKLSAREGCTVIAPSPKNIYLSHGISVLDAHDVVIEGFSCSGLPLAGIGAYRSNRLTIRNNICHGNDVWGIFTSFCADVLIEDNTCINSRDQHGIYCSNSADRPVVRRNLCRGNGRAGIQLNGDVSSEDGPSPDGIISDAVIENNTCIANVIGINLDGVQNAIIKNNTLRENLAGITLFKGDGGGPSKNNVVENNWIDVTDFGGDQNRACIQLDETATNNTIKKNVFRRLNKWGYGAFEVREQSIVGLVSDGNVFIGSVAFSMASDSASPVIMDLAQWRTFSKQDSNSVFISGV